MTMIAEALAKGIGIMIVPKVSSWKTHSTWRGTLPPPLSPEGWRAVGRQCGSIQEPDLERGSTACYKMVGTIAWPAGFKGVILSQMT